jgi:GTPase
VSYRGYQSFVMADIPGIIVGAAEGKGLGHRFLRHIERNAVLLYIIPADSEDINEEFKILQSELRKFNPELLHKQQLIAISKADMLDEQMMREMEATFQLPLPYLFISAVSGYQLDKLKDELWKTMVS